MNLLEKTIEQIGPDPGDQSEELKEHLNHLAKPPESLGRLEELAVRFGRIYGTDNPPDVRKTLFCFAGDHGVTEEGVSAYPPSVTKKMVNTMAEGAAAINILAGHTETNLEVVDVGVDDPDGAREPVHDMRVGRGTKNMVREPALHPEQAKEAIETGIRFAFDAIEKGYTLLGTGDMGIGNTTPSAAIASYFLDVDPGKITGTGTGIDSDTWEKKVSVIRTAIEHHSSQMQDPIDVAARIGGFEICAVAGVYLACGARRIPVVVDGYITTASALLAIAFDDQVRDVLVFGHRSGERGHEVMLENLNADPVLDLGMRLGEGTGAVLAMNLMEAAVRLSKEMATFESIKNEQ